MTRHLQTSNGMITVTVYRGDGEMAYKSGIERSTNYCNLTNALHKEQLFHGKPIQWDFYPGAHCYDASRGHLMAVSQFSFEQTEPAKETK